MRIVSFLPSATDIVLRLDAGSRLVARTQDCDAPASVPVLTCQPIGMGVHTHHADRLVRHSATPVEPKYTFDTERLIEANPDLFIFGPEKTDTTALEDAVRQIAQRTGRTPALLPLQALTIEDVLDNVLHVGTAIGLEDRAHDLVVSLRGRLFSAQEYVAPFESRRPVVGFIEWTEPLMLAGHWRVQMIERAGGIHPWNETRPVSGSGAAAGPQQAQRRAGASISVSPEAFSAAKPEWIVISPRGASLDEAERMGRDLFEKAWFRRLPAAVSGRVAAVDGRRCFHSPGPGIVDGSTWLVEWIQERPCLTESIEWKRLEV